VKVDVLVPPGQAPETYEPKPKQMAWLSEADVYFAIGVPFEKGLLPSLAAACPNLKVVNTQEGVPVRQMEEERSHEDHDGHDHHPGEPDPHIWLDPQLVKIQAKTICNTLAALDPAHAVEYEKNLEAFLAELEDLDKRIAERLRPHQGKTLHVFHPAFGYFVDRYGLQQVAIESGGKEPGPKRLAELVAGAKAEGVKTLFVQPEFATSSAEAIAREIGGALVLLDPVARDYVQNLESIAEKIATALSNATP
jgi:zinc transport system substrate-binding protein